MPSQDVYVILMDKRRILLRDVTFEAAFLRRIEQIAPPGIVMHFGIVWKVECALKIICSCLYRDFESIAKHEVIGYILVGLLIPRKLKPYWLEESTAFLLDLVELREVVRQ